MDSVFMRRLSGVRVVAVGTGDRTNVQGVATSDSLGFYHIDSLPAGRYDVGFESPLLDSLEITISPREVTVTEGAAVTTDLALPPAVKLRAAVCPGVTLPEGTGAIVGHVVSAETEGSLPGITIAMAWRELSFDRTALRPTNGERTVTSITDDAGWYRVCGVPTGAWLSVQLQQGGRVGPVIRTLVSDSLGLAVRHISFSAASSRAAPDSMATIEGKVDDAPLSGRAALNGVVLTPDGAAVTMADVRVVGTAAAGRTDAQGKYALTGLPAGTQMLIVRHIGYAVTEMYVDLRDGATTTREVRLKRVVSLDSVITVAVRSRYPQFVQARKSAIFGRFLGPEEIRQQCVSFASDIIEKIPGFRVVGVGYQAKVVSARGVSSVNGECPLRIVQNGMPIDGASINDIPVADIGAIEAYREGDFGPPEYDRGCGAIVIWTKR